VLGVADHVSPVQRRFEHQDLVQRRAATSAETPAVPADVADVVRTPGYPLDAGMRAFMEPRFGRDFSGVRVHVGADAAHSAHGVHAMAYTVGNHIVFGAGMFPTATHEGRRLMAHELTHVVQQTRTRNDGAKSRPGEPRAPRILSGTLPVSLQRQKIPGSVELRGAHGLVIEVTGGSKELVPRVVSSLSVMCETLRYACCAVGVASRGSSAS
jgi:hypothetical protein